MSWEAPPEPVRRWRTAASLIAVVLLILATIAVARSREQPSALTIDRIGDDSIGADPDGFVATDGQRREPLDLVETDGAGPLLPGAPRLTVVIADFGSRLQMIDVATGARDVVSVFADATRRRPDALQVVGDSIILDAAGRVLRLVDGAGGEPRQLARDHRSIPTADTSSVWLYDQLTASIGGVATRVGFDGTVRDRIALPALAQPLAGTADSLIVRTPGTVSRIGVDGSRRLIARGQALASDGTRIARLDCLGDLSCGVVVGTIDAPDRVRVTLPPGDVPVGLFDVPRARFSPDGHWLALPVYRELNNFRLEQSSVAIIDVSIGTEIDRLPGSALSTPATPLAWSGDSRWLAVSTGTRMIMWSADTGRAEELGMRLPPTYAVAVR